MEKKPNIILIVVDQMRADALSLNSKDKLISTPTLDMMASQGYNFENAYSPVPSCVPARVALLTGLDQQNSGRVGYEDGIPWDFKNTLPKTFRDEGYQTECIGKMHVFPSRKRLGFDHIVLHDGYLHFDRKYDKAYIDNFEYSSDYLRFLKDNLGNRTDIIDDGLHCNSWDARPWLYEEMYHPTNWVVSEGIKFLQSKDPTTPFFLKLSFEKPHAPLNPPKYYFDMYMERLGEEIDLHIGNWEKLSTTVNDITALKGKLKKDEQKRMIAAYYGLITHLDHQINRFLIALKEFRHDKDTIIWFVSDHGDQLGEHYLFRKGYPYQGSIRIPSFIYDPGNIIAAHNHKLKNLVKIQDLFPSLVDLVFNKSVDVDGRSVKQLLFGNYEGWRNEFHGEHALGEDSSQYIMTDQYKLIWFPVKDEYQLFDIQNDPDEMNNLYDVSKYQPIVIDLTKKLITYLKDRPEGFVKDDKLIKVDINKIKPTIVKGD
ncbi:arylsulfatase [Macrococcoides canis]|uniref:Arylsulfatase n=1 Tax=Macrococcoides canis TaxID=1855823 RepID=A0A4Y5F7N9_9STAP|nr:arylsulfatase [Macrococcus canis]QAX90279.1 Arylsulfatase [Macrococcus canis]QIH77130.1 arylsulfatase [Macrococcus canis]QNR06750.1 arylsulfatase [Macrococcus canis]